MYLKCLAVTNLEGVPNAIYLQMDERLQGRIIVRIDENTQHQATAEHICLSRSVKTKTFLFRKMQKKIHYTFM
jgi:hypothetical protein